MDVPTFSPQEAQRRTDQFHEVFYYRRLWDTVRWMGVQAYKCPFDLWIYQEILHAHRPDVVIETGTAAGGTALFLAHIMDVIGKGRVLSIDIESNPQRPSHPRITYLHGSSIDQAVFASVRSGITTGERALVILDSLHNKDHVLAELRLWSPLIPSNGLLIVEDSNINGHPVHTDYSPDQGPGAYEAVEEFLLENDHFQRDSSFERLLMTFNPGGYLRRK
ncbi:MAG: class I SAM-dependent methyltransferase [Phycisphaerales bacterium]|nr:class I SAM-dependent methyltransferase [Phycisphaerales bacterium]